MTMDGMGLTVASPVVFERARLRGSLNALPLPDVVQILGMRRRTAIIHLAAPPASGVLHLHEGEISFARFNADGRCDVTGPQAFTRMLACERGSFDVSFGACALERNVFCSTAVLLLDAARWLDEDRRGEDRGDDRDRLADFSVAAAEAQALQDVR